MPPRHGPKRSQSQSQPHSETTRESVERPHTVRVGIVRYPGVLPSALHGLQEVFQLADGICVELRMPTRFQVEEIDAGRSPVPAGLPFTAIILPPSLSREPTGSGNPLLIRWLKKQHSTGAILCAVCAGVFHLASTGLLAGKPATTHWGLATLFAERYPEVRLDVDKALINDGEFITGGGLLCWIDLGLELVGQLAHPRVMRLLGKRLVVDTHRREQRFYQAFMPEWDHGDAAILGVQKQLQRRFSHPIEIGDLAEACFLSERAFLRRFQKATGLPPSQYLQRLRVQEACDLLETTDLSQDEIAHRVGYEAGGAFRKAFVRIMGLVPRDYRARFRRS